MSDVDTFFITENDLEPALGGIIYRAATLDELAAAPTVTRYPLDLTTALAVTVILKPISGGTARRLAASFVDRVGGEWRRTWVAGDTGSAYVGSAKGRVEVTWPGTPNRPESCPTALDAAFTVTILPDDG